MEETGVPGGFMSKLCIYKHDVVWINGCVHCENCLYDGGSGGVEGEVIYGTLTS